MKKINILLYIILFTLFATACYEDLGNYDYREINEIEVDSIKSRYNCDTDDSLCIYPVLTGTQYSDTSRFTYSWEIGGKTVSVRHNLEIVVDMQPGHKYSRFIVMDKETGIKKYHEFAINVSSSTAADLIMVLSKYQGRAELSYLRLDKANANWAVNYFKDRHNEELATDPKQLAIFYCQANYYPFTNSYGRILVLADDKLRLMDKRSLQPDTTDVYLTGESYTGTASYPKPDIDGYKPEYINEVMPIFRRTGYGWQHQAYSVQISGGSLYGTTLAPNVWTNKAYPNKKSPYKGKLAPFGYWDDMSNTPSTTMPQMGYSTGDFIVFDKTARRFASGSAYGVDEIKTEDLKAFPEYDNMLWGSATNLPNTTSLAVLNNGDNCRFVLLQKGENKENKEPTKNLSAEIAAGPLVTTSSKFYMMKYTDYLFFTQGDKLYRYNLLNIQAGIAPSEKDLFAKLSDYGYAADAVITDLCVSRSEKTLLLGVSRYGSDPEGMGEEPKGDLLYFDLNATTINITYREDKSYKGISGIPVDVEIKYQNYWRDGLDIDGTLIDNI